MAGKRSFSLTFDFEILSRNKGRKYKSLFGIKARLSLVTFLQPPKRRYFLFYFFFVLSFSLRAVLDENALVCGAHLIRT